MNREGWNDRDDRPYWGCLAVAAFVAGFWLGVLVWLGIF